MLTGDLRWGRIPPMSESRAPISRRHLLLGTAAAALAAVVSACGREVDQALGTQTSTAVTRPPSPATLPATAANSPTLTVSASPTATDEASASPLDPTEDQTATEASPEVTSEPSPTPTPPATPFPPGPRTKLGLHVALYDPQVMELVATGNVALLKTLELDSEFLANVKRQSPGTTIVGRVLLDQIDLNRTDMLAEARRAVDAVLPLALDPRRSALVDAWEGYNEPVPGDEEQMHRLAELESERVRLLAGRGLRAVVGNFGAGQPALDWWPAFRPALEEAQAHGGYLGLHEYSAPTIWFNTNRAPLDFRAEPTDEGWLTLRYRKVFRQYLLPWGLGLPLLVTECGIDGLVHDRPGPRGKGYKDFGRYWQRLGMGPDTAGNYVEQLAWYDSQLQLDNYVHGSAIFTMAGSREWRSYDLRGDAARVLQQYLSVHPSG